MISDDDWINPYDGRENHKRRSGILTNKTVKHDRSRMKEFDRTYFQIIQGVNSQLIPQREIELKDPREKKRLTQKLIIEMEDSREEEEEKKEKELEERKKESDYQKFGPVTHYKIPRPLQYQKGMSTRINK